MPAERYFIPASFQAHHSLVIEGQEFHHLMHVMRAQVDDTIELINGRGDLAIAQIAQLDKKKALCAIKEVQHQAKPDFEIILAQAIPKMNRLDFILEKGTELGMTQLWLFPSQRGERKALTSHQFERMQGLSIAAMKQCGSLYAPQIESKPLLSQWDQAWLSYPAFFGDLAPDAPLCVKKLAENPQAKGVIFFIGPEGGFTDQEEANLKELQATGVKLHSNILRTETAALTALAIISQFRNKE